MVSLCHPWFTTTNLSYRFPIFETSATALCGTTGTYIQIPIYIYIYIIHIYPRKKIGSFERPNAYSGRLLGDDQERHPKHTFEPYFHDPFLQFPHTVCINVKETQDLNYNMWQLLSGAVPWRTVSPCLRANLALHFVFADWFGTNLARTVKVIQNVPWFPPPGQNYRRKFRSQTSDNMYRWKAQQGRGREKRKIRRKKSRRERVRRKKMEMREKVGKSRNTVFF